MARFFKRGSIAFQHVSGANAWFARICGWFCPVLAGKTYNEAAGPGGAVPAWCANNQVVGTMTHNDKLRFEQAGWRFYRRFLCGGKVGSVCFSSGGLKLDYSCLLLKVVADELYIPFSLKWMARKAGVSLPEYFGSLLWPEFGRRRRGWMALVGAIHGLLRWAAELRRALAYLGLETLRLSLAFLTGKRDAGGINTVWFGAATNEYGRFGSKRCFYWASRIDSKLDILYVLYRIPSVEFQCKLREEGVRWVSQFQILQFLPRLRLAALAFRLLLTTLGVLFPWRGSWILRARLVGYHFEALVWSEFARATGVRAAVTTSTTWTSQSANLIALKHVGVKTALWFYSANSIPFSHKGGRPYFNGKLRTVHEADRIYVWSPHIAEWNRKNLCEYPGERVIPIGPLMCGDASVCRVMPRRDGRLRVGVFDITTVGGRKRERFGALHLPLEYNDHFWVDMKRLLEDLPWLTLILKPKRPLGDPRREFPPAFFDLMDQMHWRQEGRVELLQDDDDPYLAIARSHAAISMPFSSPSLAAWHFGRVGIFYEPTGVLEHHQFTDFGRFFARSYESLTEILRDVQSRLERGQSIKFPGDKSRFIGRAEMDNPQKSFILEIEKWGLDSNREPGRFRNNGMVCEPYRALTP